MTKQTKICEHLADELQNLICDIANLWRRQLTRSIQRLNITGSERRVLIMLERQPGITQVGNCP